MTVTAFVASSSTTLTVGSLSVGVSPRGATGTVPALSVPVGRVTVCTAGYS